MAFRVGQKVVCVQEGPIFPEPGERGVRKGEVYTVRGLIQAPEGPGMYVEEIRNPVMYCTMGTCERAFPIGWFRPTVERKTDISVFTRMLTDKVVEVNNA